MSWVRKNAKTHRKSGGRLTAKWSFFTAAFATAIALGSLGSEFKFRAVSFSKLTWQWKVLHLQTWVSGFRKRLISSDRQSLRDDKGLANIQPRSIHCVYCGFSQTFYTFLYIPSFILTLCQWIDIDKTTPWISLKSWPAFSKEVCMWQCEERACTIIQLCCISFMECRSACLSEPSTLMPEYTQNNYAV